MITEERADQFQIQETKLIIAKVKELRVSVFVISRLNRKTIRWMSNPAAIP